VRARACVRVRRDKNPTVCHSRSIFLLQTLSTPNPLYWNVTWK